jgi:hypothetical protein
VTPVYKNTPRQAIVRARLKAIAEAWSEMLYEGQRNMWRDFALAHPRRNVFGAEKVLSGFAMFQSCNGVSLATYGGWLLDPPADLDVVGLDSMSITISVYEWQMALTFEPNPLPEKHAMYLWATEPLSPGVGCYAPMLRWIGCTEEELDSPENIAPEYDNKFGVFPEVGQKVGFRIQTVNAEKGALSVPLTTLVTVGE